MKRRTKIVATMGPATDQPGAVERLILAGVDVFRINFSHGRAAEHAERIRTARAAAAALSRDVGILCDLQGPKIRIENFAQGPVELVDGAAFALDTALGSAAGDVTVVGCAYERLPQDVAPGDTLLLNDGAIALRVDRVEGTRVACTVTQGGLLSGRKGINKLGGGLSAPALTEEDLANIRLAAEWQADFLAVSFPRTADDIHLARRLLKEAGGGRGGSSPRSNAPRRWTISSRSSKRPTLPWSPAAISAWKSARPSCRACRNASSASAGNATAR
jgi:pyruvate kinase